MLFSISLIGHALIHRTMTILAHDFAFSLQVSRHLSIVNLLLIAFITLSTRSLATVWLFIGILLITLKFIPPILRIFLQDRLRRALVPFLDAMIMGLQTGKSFRLAMSEAVESQSGWVRLQLLEFAQSIVMSENVITMKSALLKDLQAEFRQIDRSKNRVVEQLQALRRELKMLESFRRRSGQITQQIKMQAIIVTALFIALLSFVITQFGFLTNRSLIFGSCLVFVMGLLWIFLIGRRMKWKV